MKKSLFTSCVLTLLLLAAPAQAATITTLFDYNNTGAIGGAVYFDIAVGAQDITVTSLTSNLSSSNPFTFSIYTTAPGVLSAGNQTLSALWTLAATGSGTGLSTNNPSVVVLDSPFTLAAGSTQGVAFILGPTAGHQYTNGTGSNQVYSNSDLTLTLGSATNAPWEAPVFTPRVWNGSITYETGLGEVPEPATYATLAAGLGILALFRRRA